MQNLTKVLFKMSHSGGLQLENSLLQSVLKIEIKKSSFEQNAFKVSRTWKLNKKLKKVDYRPSTVFSKEFQFFQLQKSLLTRWCLFQKCGFLVVYLETKCWKSSSQSNWRSHCRHNMALFWKSSRFYFFFELEKKI